MSLIDFKIIHGLVKGAIKNIVDMVHSRIPNDTLISKKEDVVNMPELYNCLEALEKSMEKFEEYNAKGFTTSGNASYKTLMKMKDIIATAVSTDTAYYLMMEYFLKEYCIIKFKGTELESKIEELFDKQWEERMLELVKKQQEDNEKK